MLAGPSYDLTAKNAAFFLPIMYAWMPVKVYELRFFLIFLGSSTANLSLFGIFPGKKPILDPREN